MMLSIGLAFLTGSCLGALGMTCLYAKRVRVMQEQVNKISNSTSELALLRARIRAIQDKGKPLGKGERMYVVQTPTGRFAKLTLPEV